MFRSACQKFRTITIAKSSRRRLSNDAHGHSHSHATGPYSVPHHAAYPAEARIFGMEPGQPLEGWEVISWGVYAICFGVLTFGLTTKTDDSFKAWARREYLARESMLEKGEEITFGKYYQGSQYVEKMGEMPTVSE